MPELPEVQTVVSGLIPHLQGQVIRHVDLRRRDIVDPIGTPLARHLEGRTIVELARRAKRIVFTLDDANRFFIHLGMSGQLTMDSPAAPFKPHTHLLLHVGKVQVRFVDPRRFGGVWWLGQDQSVDDGIGPEPLGLRWPTLARQLARTRRAIKVALLDQSLIAGIGNIYADEALFASRIHPLTPASSLDQRQIVRLNRAIQQTLRCAIKSHGSTLRNYRDANGDVGSFQLLHKVYGRAAEPCRVCKTLIERIVLGGRSTHFCPQCQAEALGRDAGLAPHANTGRRRRRRARKTGKDRA